MTRPPLIEAASPNHDVRDGAPIDIVVLHYTGMRTGEAALARLRDPAPRAGAYRATTPGLDDLADDASLGRVSAHYVIEEDGRVFRLVPEERRAWHAGTGFWAGSADVNARSIGIEIVNGGHDYPGPDGRPPPYAEPQVAALMALLADIAARRAISPWRVIGHSDLAAERKRDPGEHFPWARLADAGLAWTAGASDGDHRRLAGPGDAGPDVRAAQEGLIAIGYGLAASGALDARTTAVLAAFQARCRQTKVDGALDAETARLIARAAAAKGQGG